MAQFFTIHPDNPQPRLISQAVNILRDSGVIVYPTDSSYALGCCLGEKTALDRIRRIRDIPASQPMTLVCRDLSEIALYAQLDNAAFRLMKSMTPGPYTFILKAKKDVPKRLQHPKRRTIGIRVPENNVAQALLEELAEPMISISLVLPDEALPENEPDMIRDKLDKQLDLIIDGGAGGLDFTTVIDMSDRQPQIVREGKGAEQLALD